jgi:hypoxanthine phosphoribosyltransferase
VAHPVIAWATLPHRFGRFCFIVLANLAPPFPGFGAWLASAASRYRTGPIMTTITREVKANHPDANAPGSARPDWLGPSLRTLLQPDFDAACADLMHLVENSFTPSVVVGIRTGGWIVAGSMVRAASTPLLVLPLTSRRAATAAKSRLPLFRTLLAALPRPVLDVLRRLEHRWLIKPRVGRVPDQWADRTEADAIASAIEGMVEAPHILVVDDAIDSGVTLATVLGLLREVCPRGTEIRSAAVTQTLENPIVKPDYVLFHGTLCRFPWSFDARG